MWMTRRAHLLLCIRFYSTHTRNYLFTFPHTLSFFVRTFGQIEIFWFDSSSTQNLRFWRFRTRTSSINCRTFYQIEIDSINCVSQWFKVNFQFQWEISIWWWTPDSAFVEMILSLHDRRDKTVLGSHYENHFQRWMRSIMRRKSTPHFTENRKRLGLSPISTCVKVIWIHFLAKVNVNIFYQLHLPIQSKKKWD